MREYLKWVYKRIPVKHICGKMVERSNIENSNKPPNNLSDFINRPIGAHQVNYWGGIHTTGRKIKKTKGILKHGILNGKIVSRLAKKGIRLEGIPKLALRGGDLVFYYSLTPSPANISKLLYSAQKYGPIILHNKVGIGYNSPDWQKTRIQPRFIKAVILPKVGAWGRNRYIRELKEFGKPIYDHTGQLVWKQGMEE